MAVTNSHRLFMRWCLGSTERILQRLELKLEHVRQVIGEAGAEENRYKARYDVSITNALTEAHLQRRRKK